ncbi:MAG: hypothetical protein J0665_04270 [Deltaproteobacteria bacterium]|nr:hypothetical protein [Deltaproteobacteria bacterium]
MRANLFGLVAALSMVASSSVVVQAGEAENFGAAVAVNDSNAYSKTETTNIDYDKTVIIPTENETKTTTITPTDNSVNTKESGNAIASNNTLTKTTTITPTDNSVSTKESGNAIASNNTLTKTTTITPTDNSVNTKTEDSFNKDIDIETETETTTVTKESGNSIASGNTQTKTKTTTITPTDNSVNTDNSVENKGSFNTKTETETETEIEESYNTENTVEESYNTENKVEESYNTRTATDDHSVNVTVGDVAVAVASTVLAGAVSSNTIDMKCADLSTGYNDISGSAFQSAAGINAVSQNSGVNSMLQQSVNVQSNMSLNPIK